MIDILMTTCGRRELFRKSLESFGQHTDPSMYRLTVICDDGNHDVYPLYTGKQFTLYNGASASIKNLIIHDEPRGLGPSLNEGLRFIQTMNEWDEDHPGKSENNFICYLQDDLLYTPGWLQILIQRFCLFEKSYNLLFASGLECIEHREGLVDIGGGMQVKNYIRAACMFARRSTFINMLPIPPIDPETGNIRARPNNGIGSGVDWHFLRNHNLSAERTGEKCLVIPGLIKHMGYDKSTWLKRELPESESDKEKIRELLELL